MLAGNCTRVPNSGTSKVRHSRRPPTGCDSSWEREDFSLEAEAMFGTPLAFFCSAGPAGAVTVLGGVCARLRNGEGLRFK
jgi:hypothetical protein